MFRRGVFFLVMTTPRKSVATNPYQGYTEETDQAPARMPRRARFKQLSGQAGVYAGVLASVLAVFAVGGAVWGLFRPTYTAYVEDAESASVAVQANVEFTAFIWFAVATGVLGAVVALIVFLRSVSTRGLGMLVWLGVVAFVGAGAFLAFGNFSAGLIHGEPADYATAVGQSFNMVPNMVPGTAVFTAPFLAVCMYWCATFVTPVEPEVGEALPD